jgi:hypothetical protein
MFLVSLDCCKYIKLNNKEQAINDHFFHTVSHEELTLVLFFHLMVGTGAIHKASFYTEIQKLCTLLRKVVALKIHYVLISTKTISSELRDTFILR